jgi:hypothetical protein
VPLGHDLPDLNQIVADDSVEDGNQQGFFAREMPIDGRSSEAEGFADVVDADGAVPAGGKEPGCDRDEFFFTARSAPFSRLGYFAHRRFLSHCYRRKAYTTLLPVPPLFPLVNRSKL